VPETDRSAPPPGGPTLVAVAHGTRDPDGIGAVEALLDRVRELRPGLAVRAAYLEIALPSVEVTVTKLTGPLVVVPLLLASGYHATVDIPSAVAAGRRDPADGEVRIGAALGPHPLLARALLDRLRAAGWRHGDPVVLGAAGSADPAAATSTAAQARLLGALVGAPVLAAYASAAAPSVPEAIGTLRAAGADRIALASYLLAPGHFQARLAAAGADLLSDPLGRHDAVARVVLARYDEARLG